MTTDSTDLLLENLVIETSFEFTLSRVGGSDVHSGLSTAEDDKVLVRCDGGAVERSVGNVGLHDFEIGGVDELGGLVFRGCDEVCAVWGPLEIGDLQVWLVDLDVVELLSRLIIVSSATATLYRDVYVPLHRTAKLIHPHVQR